MVIIRKAMALKTKKAFLFIINNKKFNHKGHKD